MVIVINGSEQLSIITNRIPLPLPKSCRLKILHQFNQVSQFKLLEEKGNVKKTSVGKIQGELKLSLEYRKDALLVMVHHAKDLAMPDGSKEAPNSYVKVLYSYIAIMDI